MIRGFIVRDDDFPWIGTPLLPCQRVELCADRAFRAEIWNHDAYHHSRIARWSRVRIGGERSEALVSVLSVDAPAIAACSPRSIVGRDKGFTQTRPFIATPCAKEA